MHALCQHRAATGKKCATQQHPFDHDVVARKSGTLDVCQKKSIKREQINFPSYRMSERQKFNSIISLFN